MEHLDPAPVQVIEEEGYYPEPDYVPPYPWLGQQELGGSPLVSTYPTGDNDPMLPAGFGGQNHDTEVGRFGSVIDLEMDQSLFPHSLLRLGDDAALDPDFELSEESRV